MRFVKQSRQQGWQFELVLQLFKTILSILCHVVVRLLQAIFYAIKLFSASIWYSASSCSAKWHLWKG